MNLRFSSKTFDLRILEFSRRNGVVRYSIILLIALFFAHFRKSEWPFDADYEFPLRAFGNILMFGFFICTFSWIVTNYFKDIIFLDRSWSKQAILRFLVVNWLSTLIIYTLLFIFINGVNYSRTYLTFLFVSFSVVTIENLFYLLYSSFKFHNDSIKVKNESSVFIRVANKRIKLSFDELAYVALEKGIVTVFKKDGSKLSTVYNTMDELEKELPKHVFFRANRQVIINKSSISQIADDVNRKLIIQLNEGLSNISVSRYRRKELMEWAEIIPAVTSR